MKKLSTVIIILILEIVFHNMNYVNAQPDPKLDELESSTLNWTNSMRIDIVNLRK